MIDVDFDELFYEQHPPCRHLSVDDPLTEAQLLTGIRPREWTVVCEDCGETWTHHRGGD
jgi:hypothetical protein